MTLEGNDRNTIPGVQCAGLLLLEWFGHRGQAEYWLLASTAPTFQTGVCIRCPGGPRAEMLRAGTQARGRALVRAVLSLFPASGDFGLPTSFGAAGESEPHQMEGVGEAVSWGAEGGLRGAKG